MKLEGVISSTARGDQSVSRSFGDDTMFASGREFQAQYVHLDHLPKYRISESILIGHSGWGRISTPPRRRSRLSSHIIVRQCATFASSPKLIAEYVYPKVLPKSRISEKPSTENQSEKVSAQPPQLVSAVDGVSGMYQPSPPAQLSRLSVKIRRSCRSVASRKNHRLNIKPGR